MRGMPHSLRGFAVAAMDAVPLTREGRGLGVGRLSLSSSDVLIVRA